MWVTGAQVQSDDSVANAEAYWQRHTATRSPTLHEKLNRKNDIIQGLIARRLNPSCGVGQVPYSVVA